MTGRKQVCTADGCTNKPVGRRLCRTHYQRAWKAGELGQHKPLPTRKVNRVVCPPEHNHAKNTTCYIQHQCRCDPCTDLSRDRENRRLRLIAYGRYDSGLVDADPVREHVMKLSEYGIGYKRVAQIAGVSITGVRSLVHGRQDPGPRYGELPKRIAREKAAKILAVEAKVENLGRRQGVPSLGAVRRVQALVTQGWSITKIGNRLHMSGENFWSIIQKDVIGAGTFRRLADLYEELWNQLPPQETHRDRISVSRAKKYAKARNWLPPMAWDDIDTDPHAPVADEALMTDEMAIELALEGEDVKLSSAERRIAVERLHAMRWSANRIAETLHVNPKTVERIRKELGLESFALDDIVGVAA